MTAGGVPAWRRPGKHARGGGNGRPPQPAKVTPPSAARDIDGLCAKFADVCQSAVDPMEISSALEFDGVNDQAAWQLYGVPDVFALAEEMYRRVPRHPAEPAPSADPWRSSKISPVLHGLLYGLPTVCFPAAVGLLTGADVLAVLIVALLSSWALSQALAHLGYLRLGRNYREAARLLLAGLIAAFAAVALAMVVTGLVAREHVSALIFGLGLGGYMIGATVLMVLGAERLLLCVLAPGVLGSAAFLLLGRPAHLEHLTWAALAATPLLALGLASARASRAAGYRRPSLRRDRRALPGRVKSRLFVPSELRDALPSAGFGLVAAGLLVFPVAAGLPGHRANTGAVLASLPLALSMGAAEWSLVWYRRRTQRLLRGTGSLPAFATRARLVLLAALVQYVAAATLLTVAVIAVADATRLVHPHWALLPEVASYLALGGAMFLALLLQAFGSRTFPLIACIVALAFEIGWRHLGVLGQITACTELLLVLAGYAALKLGRAVRHAL